MGKGYNDKGEDDAEKADAPRSKEFPSIRVDKTQTQEETPKRDEKVERCVVWAQEMLVAPSITKFSAEYKELKDYKPSLSHAISEKMADKNRYGSIFCADDNRVVLKERDSANDYIHASWMEMPDHVKFISTQGPIKNTIADFWHMIYTEKCQVVVMLCQYIENDQEKCQRYFSEASEKEFGEYRVKVAEKTTELFNPVKYTVVQVQKKNSSTKHLVHHYWYHDWEDHIAPLDPLPMVKMYSDGLKKANGKPIVVHCSAGIGRTATFVGIHLGFCMIRENSSMQMPELFKKLRKMRFGAIQSQLQYIFLITCIIQLFIYEKYLPRDAKFEKLLTKYSTVTKKVMNRIAEEEAAEKNAKKEEAKEEKKEKKDAEAVSKGKKAEKEVPSKNPKKVEKGEKGDETKEVASKNTKKAEKGDEMKEAVSKNPKAKEAPSKNAKKDEPADEKTKDEKRNDHPRKDANTSPSVVGRVLTQSGKENSKFQKADTKNGKKATKKTKKKPNIFGF